MYTKSFHNYSYVQEVYPLCILHEYIRQQTGRLDTFTGHKTQLSLKYVNYTKPTLP